jgi:hypothetical protein
VFVPNPDVEAVQPTFHQDLGFTAFPTEASHRVTGQTAQQANALIAVDQHQHDRNLLANVGEGSQQAPFRFGPCDAQLFGRNSN